MEWTQPVESCPSFESGKKIKDHQQEYLWRIFKGHPTYSSRQALTMLVERGIVLSVSIRHVNRLRVKWGLNRKKGRPLGKTQKTQESILKLKNIIGKTYATKKYPMRRRIYL